MNLVVTDEFRVLGITSGVVAEIAGLKIAPMHDALEALKATVAADILAKTDADFEDSPVVQSYKELVQSVGRSAKRFPPAALNLVRQVRRVGQLPTINTAVDSYNIAAAQSLLALGVHDRAKIGDTITFRLSPGDEYFRAVGSPDEKRTQAGDYVYADDKRVLAWLDSKDSDDVKVTDDTRGIVIVIQGTHKTSRDYITSWLQEACSLVTQFCGGDVVYHTIG